MLFSITLFAISSALASECASPVPREPMCIGISEPTHNMGLRSFHGCYEDPAQNCLADFIGSQELLFNAPAAAELALTERQSQSLVKKTKGDTYKKVALEYDPELAELVTTLLVTALRKRSDEYRKASHSHKAAAELIKSQPGLKHDGTNLSRIVDEAEQTVRKSIYDVFEKAAHESEQKAWVALIAGGNSCMRVIEAIKSLKGEERARALQEALVCMARLVGERTSPTLRRWPGCRCEGNAGVLLEGVCIKNAGERFFGDLPIDEDVPLYLKKFIAALNKKAAPLKVKNIGMVSCGVPRPHHGSAISEVAEEKRLRLEHLSSHMQAASCDLSYVDFTDGKNDIRLNLYRKQTYPFKEAFDKYIKYTGETLPFGFKDQKRVEQRDPDEFWQTVETAAQSEPPKGFSRKTWQTLRLGTIIRNAAADAGFCTFDLTTNSAHHGHNHMELPVYPENASHSERRAVCRGVIRDAAGVQEN